MSIRDLSYYKGLDYDPTFVDKLAGNGRGLEYSYWDQTSNFLCSCENGYGGADCSQSKFIIFTTITIIVIFIVVLII